MRGILRLTYYLNFIDNDKISCIQILFLNSKVKHLKFFIVMFVMLKNLIETYTKIILEIFFNINRTFLYLFIGINTYLAL